MSGIILRGRLPLKILNIVFYKQLLLSLDVLTCMKKIKDFESESKEYSITCSSKSLYKVDVDMDCRKSKILNSFNTSTLQNSRRTLSTTNNVELGGTLIPSSFGVYFLEMVIRALFQSTTILMGPSFNLLRAPKRVSTRSPFFAIVLSTIQGTSSRSLLLATEGVQLAST